VRPGAHRARLRKLGEIANRETWLSQHRAAEPARRQWRFTLEQLFGLIPMTQTAAEDFRAWSLENGWKEGPDGDLVEDEAFWAAREAESARNRRWLAFMASTTKRPCWDDFLELEAKREQDELVDADGE
jgi:hypothetical protein